MVSFERLMHRRERGCAEQRKLKKPREENEGKGRRIQSLASKRQGRKEGLTEMLAVSVHRDDPVELGSISLYDDDVPMLNHPELEVVVLP